MTNLELLEELDYYRCRCVYLDNALDAACHELEQSDDKLRDLYSRLDIYRESKDRAEWKKELLERAK